MCKAQPCGNELGLSGLCVRPGLDEADDVRIRRDQGVLDRRLPLRPLPVTAPYVPSHDPQTRLDDSPVRRILIEAHLHSLPALSSSARWDASYQARSTTEAVTSSFVVASNIVDLIDAHGRRWGDSHTQESTFGAIGARGVASWYERVCITALGTPASRGLFFGASAGCVRGRRVGRRSRGGHQGLSASVGTRCPSYGLGGSAATLGRRIRLPGTCGSALPVRWGGSEHRPLPSRPRYATSRLGRNVGLGPTSLAQAIWILRDENAEQWIDRHAMDRPSESLYPIPHNPLFDFTLHAEEAAWIDGLAVVALETQTRDDATPQMLHGDWSARNIRIIDHRLVASYDWDSLGAFRESKGVGIAAATWRSNGERDDPPAPDSGEIRAYVEAYVEAAGGTRSRQWRAAAMGAALYTLAYTARCEHSVEARDPHYRARRARRARDTLAADRSGFIAALEKP